MEGMKLSIFGRCAYKGYKYLPYNFESIYYLIQFAEYLNNRLTDH